MSRPPHPIPYQGSKRALAPLIARWIPSDTSVFYEPFAGSAALSLFAAQHNLAKRFVICDALHPLIELWRRIVQNPGGVARQYQAIWEGQTAADDLYFNLVRDRYNAQNDPVDLLYLMARCVKNAIRFNAKGRFTQSVDKRRLGVHPKKMEVAISRSSDLLRGRVEFRAGDWRSTTDDATSGDFVYLDPPYLGTSIGRDKRYFSQVTSDELCDGLSFLNLRKIRFVLSYDGKTGAKVYGPPLPKALKLKHLLVEIGRSSQSTLNGKDDVTFESLYISEDVASGELESSSRKLKPKPDQLDFG